MTLVSVVLIAAVLRFFHLGKQSLFLDEAWSWMASKMPVTGILHLMQIDPHPVLYYLFLKAWLSIIPDTAWGIRSLSVLFSLASIYLLVWFVKRYWNIQAAIFAGWFVAWCTFEIYYAQEGRMYSLLGFLWLLSFVMMIDGIYGNPKAFWAFGLANIFLVWTHFYGMLVVGTHILLVVCFLWWKRRSLRLSKVMDAEMQGRDKKNSSLHIPAIRENGFPKERDYWIGIGLSLLGVLIVLPLLWHFKTGDAGGAWLPRWVDLLDLFNAVSIGLSSIRFHFLNADELALPFLALINRWGWFFVGMIVSGGFVLHGVIRTWMQKPEYRILVLFSIFSGLLPVSLAFGYAFLFHRNLWALKPFIGLVYLCFLWAGVGVAALKLKFIKVVAILLVVSLGVLEIVPFYFHWHKSTQGDAFRTLSIDEETSAVVLSRLYTSPVVFYYLGEETIVWGLRDAKTDIPETHFDTALYYDYGHLKCHDDLVSEIDTLYVYGFDGADKDVLERFPPCFAKKHLVRFDAGKWRDIRR